MNKIGQLLIHSSPLVLGVILSYFFWQSTYVLLFLYIAITLLIIFTGKDKKIEVEILVYGIVVGSLIEIIGTQVSGYQSFAKPDFMGIPLWLSVSWGYGFILMKRAALIFVKDSPWA